MQMLYYTFCVLGLIVLSEELPVIQLEYKTVISEEGTIAEIFLDGVAVTPSDGRTGEYDLLPGSASLRDVLRIFANRFNNTENQTYQHCRKCIFDGYQIHVSDQIMHNGKGFLAMDQTTDTWTALDPKALFLKEELDRDHERSVEDRVRFQEVCTKLLKEPRHSQSAPKVSAAVLIPLATLVLFLLVFLSFIISKYGAKGSAQPAGGVLGSIIHYPAPTLDIVGEPVKQPSNSIKASLLNNMP